MRAMSSRARSELHGHHGFGDQLGRERADDVHAENGVGLRVGEDLDEAVRFAESTGAAVGDERKLPDRYSTPAAFSSCSVLPTQAISGEV